MEVGDIFVASLYFASAKFVLLKTFYKNRDKDSIKKE